MRATTLLLGILIISSEPLLSEQKAGLDWWAFQKITRPEIPKSENSRNSKPIDAFILSELEKNKIRLSPKSSQEELIKRIYYDLIGLVYYLLLNNNFETNENLFIKKNKFKGKIGIFEINKKTITHQLNFYEIQGRNFKEIF